MSGETQTWGERKKALERGELVVISKRHDDNRRTKARKDKRAEALRHAQSRDAYDIRHGYAQPGSTANVDRLKAGWQREDDRGTAREEFEADVQNQLEAREEQRRRAAVEEEAELREREQYATARLHARGHFEPGERRAE